MTKKILIVLLAAFLNAAYINYIELIPSGDSDLYIYGKVFTDSDEVYTGQIRWGKEEAFWFDHFNSSKPENDYLQYLSKKELKALKGYDDEDNVVVKGLFGWTKNRHWNSDHTHQFACQFGHIKSIEIGRRDKVEVELKNGQKIKLDGGSNDIGTYVQVNDPELGHIKIDWDDIERVEFGRAPSSLESYYGRPLYGTVAIEDGTNFTGFVQWDHDERLGNDELNGEANDGDMDIKFANISKIKKVSRGSQITTKSGRSFKLKGSNDVNDDNRGIIVNIPGQGRIDIPWDEFDEVTFSDFGSISISYDDFNGHEEINGTVTTNDGERLTGRIVYDLDETYYMEILNGEVDDVEYFIPFYTIEKIQPSSRKRTEVTFAGGKKIKLENSVDVTEDNDGVLVFSNKSDEPVYIPWEDISEISL